MNARTVYVPSRTRPGRRYRVDVGIDGTPHCSCESAAFSKRCWHAAYVLEEMNLTETSTAIVPVQMRPPTALIPSDNELARMGKVAEIILAGGMDLPDELNTPAKVMAVMLKGRALGLDPTIAIEHIHLIDGHSVPDAQIMAALLARDDPSSKLLVEKLTETECTMRIIRPSRGIDAPYTVKITDTDVALLVKRDTPHQANARGGGTYMTRPGAWVQYPRDRLRWHCTKRILKIYAPEVINGMGSFGLAFDGENTPVRLESEYEDGRLTFTRDDGSTVDAETGEIHEVVGEPEAVQAPPRPPEAPAPPTPDPEPDASPDDLKKAAEAIYKDLKGSLDSSTLAKVDAWLDETFHLAGQTGSIFIAKVAKNDVAPLYQGLVYIQQHDGALRPQEVPGGN